MSKESTVNLKIGTGRKSVDLFRKMKKWWDAGAQHHEDVLLERWGQNAAQFRDNLMIRTQIPEPFC